MNSIIRLILRRVISGNVPVTPQLLKALEECDPDHPNAEPPKNSAKDPATPPATSHGAPPAEEKHLTFVNPLPGRWVRRTECGVGGALLLAGGLAHAASISTTLDTANNAFAQVKYTELYPT